MDTELFDSLRALIKRAMFYVQYSYKYILDDNVDDNIAIAYLNIASSKMSAAESLYYSRFDELSQTNSKALFHLFDVYANELLDAVVKKHSHRWTGIGYDNLKECFDNSVFASNN